MTPTHTRKPGAKQYRYYVTTTLNRIGRDACTVGRVPAGEIEGAVVDQLRAMLQTPEVIVRTWLAARDMEAGGSATNPIGPSLTEAEVRDALIQLDPLWDELFPAEQARIVQLLVGRVEVSQSGVSVHLRTDGMATLVADMGTRQPKPAPHAKEPKQTRLERAA